MSVPVGPLPSTLRTFLFGADSVSALADSFVEVSGLDDVSARVAKRLGDGALDGFRQQLATAAADFVNLDPSVVIRDGLRKHRELVAIAEQTAAAGSSALVPLGTRRLELTQHPKVDVEVDGEPLGTVGFELRLTIDIADVAALVREGSLVELEGARCELYAQFSLAPDEMLSHQVVAFDPNLAVPLGDGIRLAG